MAFHLSIEAPAYLAFASNLRPDFIVLAPQSQALR